MIRVAVSGAAGRMGQAVCTAVDAAADMELTGRADPALGDEPRRGAAAGATSSSTSPRRRRDSTNALACLRAGVHVVVGTTGFDPAPLAGVTPDGGGAPANALIAPNFAIGAVLMMRFAARQRGTWTPPRSSSCTTTASSTRRAGPPAHRGADGRSVGRRRAADPLGAPARASSRTRRSSSEPRARR